MALRSRYAASMFLKRVCFMISFVRCDVLVFLPYCLSRIDVLSLFLVEKKVWRRSFLSLCYLCFAG
jgi:hypothetical protein